MSYIILHSVVPSESCSMYHVSPVGVFSWDSIHSSAAVVFCPACFSAKIARAVSRTFPQLFVPLVFSFATHWSKMLSGVARIVSAVSWVDSVAQFAAFVSRHTNPFSISVSFAASASGSNRSVINNRVNTPVFFMIK